MQRNDRKGLGFVLGHRRCPATTSLARMLCAVVAVMLLAACGGGAEQAEPEPAAPGGEETQAAEGTEAEATEAMEPTTVSIGVTSFNSLHLWLLAARDENLFEPYGIDLDIVTFQNTGQIVPAIIGESVQFGLVTPESVFAVQQETPEFKMVAATVGTNPYTLVATPEITSIEQLQGSVLGVTSVNASADFFTIRLMLREHGLELDQDYTMVNAGPPPERVAAMTAGQLDGVANFEPGLLILTDAGMNVLDQASNYESLQNIVLATISAMEPWYTENREVAERFVAGVIASIDWLYDPANEERMVELIANEMSVSQEHAQATYDRFVKELEAYPRDAQINLEALQNSVRNATAAGVEFVPSEDDLEGRYDNSLAEAGAQLVESGS